MTLLAKKEKGIVQSFRAVSAVMLALLLLSLHGTHCLHHLFADCDGEHHEIKPGVEMDQKSEGLVFSIEAQSEEQCFLCELTYAEEYHLGEDPENKEAETSSPSAYFFFLPEVGQWLRPDLPIRGPPVMA